MPHGKFALANHDQKHYTQIWVVTHHQYGISVLVSKTSFCGKTSGGVANCQHFFSGYYWHCCCETLGNFNKQRHFWAMYVNQKRVFFPFNKRKRCQNFTAKCPFSYKEDLWKFRWNYCPRMQKAHFQLTCVTQKCLICLSSLLYIFFESNDRVFVTKGQGLGISNGCYELDPQLQ